MFALMSMLSYDRFLLGSMSDRKYSYMFYTGITIDVCARVLCYFQ